MRISGRFSDKVSLPMGTYRTRGFQNRSGSAKSSVCGLIAVVSLRPNSGESPSELIFKGFLAKDELAVWIGHEKCFKTIVVLNLCICAAIGRDFLGFQFAAPQPLRVVMFDYESQDNSIHRRYAAICNATRLSDEHRYQLLQNLKIIKLREMIQQGFVIPRIDDRNRGEAFWRDAAATYPADLYVIDPMGCLHR